MRGKKAAARDVSAPAPKTRKLEEKKVMTTIKDLKKNSQKVKEPVKKEVKQPKMINKKRDRAEMEKKSAF